jgi:phospholipase A-2-activating protein
MAAQTFLVKNELPSSYLDEVVAFIHKNTNGATLGQEAQGQSTYVDPYTGSSRYTGATGPASTNQGYSDPFTGMSATSVLYLELISRRLGLHFYPCACSYTC